MYIDGFTMEGVTEYLLKTLYPIVMANKKPTCLLEIAIYPEI